MTGRRFAMAGDHALLVPIPDEAGSALEALLLDHRAEVDAVLAPFGLALDDLAEPTFLRFVHLDEVTGMPAVEPVATLPDASPSEVVAAGIDAAARSGGGAVRLPAASACLGGVDIPDEAVEAHSAQPRAGGGMNLADLPPWDGRS